MIPVSSKPDSGAPRQRKEATPRLIDVEQTFRTSLREAGVHLETAYQSLLSRPEMSLTTREVTEAVLLRVGAFYAFQEHAKRTIGTGAIRSGAYFFADSVYLYLKAVLASRRTPAEVRSEEPVTTAGGKIKPDISVWCGAACVAAVECKTQMGWRGHRRGGGLARLRTDTRAVRMSRRKSSWRTKRAGLSPAQ